MNTRIGIALAVLADLLARGVSACGVYLPDLEQPRPPDLQPGLVRLRVVVSND
jgi:hypothetical protein